MEMCRKCVVIREKGRETAELLQKIDYFKRFLIIFPKKCCWFAKDCIILRAETAMQMGLSDKINVYL